MPLMLVPQLIKPPTRGYCRSKWITGTRCLAANAAIAALARQHRVGGDEHRVRSLADEGLERGREIVLARHIEHKGFLSENRCRRLGVVLFGIVRIHQERHLGSRGELIQDLDALGAGW